MSKYEGSQSTTHDLNVQSQRYCSAAHDQKVRGPGLICSLVIMAEKSSKHEMITEYLKVIRSYLKV